MPKNTTKRKKFTPRPKKTLTPEPDWKKLQQAKTEDEQIAAWLECDAFVHTEVTDKEYLHSTKKWIRDISGWGLYEQAIRIPDVYLATIGKNGWKAYRLGFMPDRVKEQFKKELLDMIRDVEKLRESMVYEAPIHPSLSELEDDHHLHPSKVKVWLEAWKKYLSSFKKNETVTREQTIAQVYVYNMQIYLKSGVWLDSHYGEKRENKIMPVCSSLAYDKYGVVKRNVGVYYPDIHKVWSKELECQSQD